MWEDFMRRIASRILFSAGIILGLAQSAHAAPPTDIQMLPPVNFGATTACSGTNVGVLYWDGSSPIECIPGFSGDASGNVSATGNLAIGGDASITGNVAIGPKLTIKDETVGPITAADSDTLNNLNGLAACATNYALAKTSATGFACVAVTDLTGVGTVTLPTCTTGQYLFWDGSTFSCPVLPTTAAPPPTCNGAGQALQFDGTNYSCVTIGATACSTTFPDGDPAPASTSGYVYPDCAAAGGSPIPLFLCQPNGAWAVSGALGGCP
jgi:hypothetical protein